MAAKKTPKRGRPPLPAAKRSADRVTVRFVPSALAQLHALSRQLGLSDVEVVRLAVAELAARKL
jgi:hypothetical protein